MESKLWYFPKNPEKSKEKTEKASTYDTNHSLFADSTMIYTTASTLAFLWRLMLSNTSQHSCKLVKICVGITVGCDKTVVFVALGMITGWFVSMLWSSLSMCNTGSPSGRPWGLMASHCYAVTKIKLFYVLGSFFKYETFMNLHELHKTLKIELASRLIINKFL